MQIVHCRNSSISPLNLTDAVGEGTLPWAVFRFRIFSNYNLTMYGNFCLDLYQFYYI